MALSEEKKIGILMLEDGVADAELASHALLEAGFSFSLKRVETRSAFIRELREGKLDVILSDHALPSFDGFTALAIAQEKRPEIPFIFFSGSLGEEGIIDALKRGATDCVLKHHPGNLAPAVRRALRESEERNQRQRREEAIGRWNAELERRVAERTAQLEAANQELEAFSYSVSHDLRAPLRHIEGFVEILQTSAVEKLDEESRQHLDTIARASRQMGKLIDDLLAFSRMSRSAMNKKPVSLANLVEEVAHHAREQLKEREIEWVIGNFPDVLADPEMLRQVLVNLIDNALKYTRTRKPARIELGARETENEVIFHIRDNGVGFDMHYLDKLFGVFQRLHRASEFEGTGVGLANVRRIIHRQGGRTWAEGAVNQGATFYFSLPKRVQ